MSASAMQGGHNKRSELFNKKAASPTHMDGSIVFDRWRQCAPPPNTRFLGPTQVPTPNGMHIDRLSHLLDSLRHTVPVLYNRPPLPTLKIAPSHRRSGPPNTMVHWTHRSPHAKQYLHRFRRFCRSHDRDRPAARPCTLLRLRLLRCGLIKW